MKKKTYKNEAYEILNEKVDYLNYVTRSSTKEQRRKFDIGDIFINAAVCSYCEDYIRSINRHDCKTCSCGNVSVDGGSWYAKRSCVELDAYIDIIEPFYDAQEKSEENNIKVKFHNKPTIEFYVNDKLAIVQSTDLNAKLQRSYRTRKGAKKNLIEKFGDVIRKLSSE